MKLSSVAAISVPVVYLCFVAPTWQAPFAGARANAASGSENEMISRGVALRKEGDDQAACEIFRQAYERFHSARAAGQLGLAEQALGRWSEAEAHVREALRSPADPWVRKNHDALSHDMLVITAHVARIEILGQPEGAEIVVNGRAAGRLPLASPVTTSAGEVDLEARAEGFQPEVKKLTLTAGQYQRVVIRLQKSQTPEARVVPPAAMVTTPPAGAVASRQVSPPPSAASGQPASEEPASGIRPIAKWTALGLSGAGLALGVASTVYRANKLSAFKSAHGGVCSEMAGRAVDHDGLPVPECQGLLDSYNGARTWQFVGFISAGAFAATWLALMLTEPPPAGAPTNVAHRPSLSCGPSPDLSGAVCLLSL
jgi:tetratricopeptide (TPR) repeat protein